MKRRISGLLLSLMATLLWTGCGRNSSQFGYSVVDGSLTVTRTADGEDIQIEADDTDAPDDIEVSDDVPVDLDGPIYVSAPSDDDADGDDIPDDDDKLPDICTRMHVTSRGISAARVLLNNEEIVSPSAFDNTDKEFDVAINLIEGRNNLKLFLSGEPGDELCVDIYSCNVSTSATNHLIRRCLTRVEGPPQASMVGF